MLSAKEVFQIQRNLRSAQERLSELRADLYAAAQSGPSLMDSWDASERHPEVIAGEKVVTEIEEKLEAAQREIGGKVYRIPEENLTAFNKKVEKLNRRAIKLNCLEITTRDEEIEEEESDEKLYTWHYIVMQGSAPMVPGFNFIAALDHTVQVNEGDPVILKRVPGTDEDVDLSAYFNADTRCEHCNKVRSRNTTYLIQEVATGKISKVGSSCLRDFTGANDPEKVASYMEYLLDFDEESDSMGDNYSGGRIARTTLSYLTHVAACIRVDGWNPRSGSSFATADQAWDNIRFYGKMKEDGYTPQYIELQDEDTRNAEAAIEWAKDLKGNGDFEHNLKVMAGLEYMPKKGDGIVAYIVQGYVKAEIKKREDKAEEERKQNAEPITEGRQEISGTILSIYEKHTAYGMNLKMTVLDDRGFKVNGSVPSGISANEGDRVTFTATVEPKDDTFGWYKRPSKAKIDEEIAA